MIIPKNATHWTPDGGSSRRVFALDCPGGAHVDTLKPFALPDSLTGDEALEGRYTWAVVGREPETTAESARLDKRAEVEP
jgi:hypothetical protein